MQIRGPRRNIKIGGRVIEERLAPPPDDDGQTINELLAGITDYDLQSGMSNFGRWAASQAKSNPADFRGVPTMRQDAPMLGEEFGSEINPDTDPSQSGVPVAIDFQRDDSYDQHDAQIGQQWENDDLGHNMRDVTDQPYMEQSYNTQQDTDPLDWQMQRYGRVAGLDELDGIFDEEK